MRFFWYGKRATCDLKMLTHVLLGLKHSLMLDLEYEPGPKLLSFTSKHDCLHVDALKGAGLFYGSCYLFLYVPGPGVLLTGPKTDLYSDLFITNDI